MNKINKILLAALVSLSLPTVYVNAMESKGGEEKGKHEHHGHGRHHGHHHGGPHHGKWKERHAAIENMFKAIMDKLDAQAKDIAEIKGMIRK